MDVSRKILLRAERLARIASDMLWGGEHGWEEATDEQFDALCKKLRERLRVVSA